MYNYFAVMAARLGSHSPYGNFFLARNLAKWLPALRCYPLQTRYGRIYCDLGETVCLPLLRFGEYPHWRLDEETIARIPLGPNSVVLDIGANITAVSARYSFQSA